MLLAGAVSPNSLAARVGRSVLDLPLDGSLRLLDVWRRRLGDFLRLSDSGPPDPGVLILAGEASPLPTISNEGAGPPVRAERDSSQYRGTAGVLRDLCDSYGDDDHVLVGIASQCPDEGLLDDLVAESDPADGVTLSVGTDGAPGGLMLVRCGALKLVPSVGYIDLKEQALPRIASAFGARVVVSHVGGTRPIRDPRSYLDAIRSWHRCGSLRGACSEDPFKEHWAPTFSIVEAGAMVEESARLYDSVVLMGGVVERDAQLVRSVVGPHGIVRRADRVMDQLVLGSDGTRLRGRRRPGGVDR